MAGFADVENSVKLDNDLRRTVRFPGAGDGGVTFSVSIFRFFRQRRLSSPDKLNNKPLT